MVIDLCRVARVDLTEKVTFDGRLEGGKEAINPFGHLRKYFK